MTRKEMETREAQIDNCLACDKRYKAQIEAITLENERLKNSLNDALYVIRRIDTGVGLNIMGNKHD